MKFVCEREKLASALNFLNGVAPKRSNLEVQQNIYLVAAKGTLVLSARNSEIAAAIELPLSDLSGDGSALINAEKIARAVASEKSDRLEFTIDEQKATAQTSRSKFEFALANDRFAEVPKIDRQQTVYQIAVADLRDAVNRVKNCVGNESSGRIVFSGICLNITGDGTQSRIDFVASDGKRMAIVNKPINAVAKGTQAEIQVVVPPRGLIDLLKLCDSEGRSPEGRSPEGQGGVGKATETPTLDLQLNDNELLAETSSGAVFVARLLEGAYPNYRKVIPSEENITLVASRAELLDGLRLVGSFCPDGETPRVELNAANDKLVLSAESSIAQGRTEMAVKIVGGEMKMLYNCHYLLDALTSMSGEEVTFSINNAEKPMKTVEGDFTCVLTPLSQR
ncbi:DNA polymerase III subunit beta [Planctomycetales bacterium]|nr:DNA polymerase III subunit beta [Planctomycetales bacterium]GHT00056.1 DNA polymerase III subunit beta [Planctomycetales bacterium]GHT07128.1 DNA polymerase III subunit beta [Planctomycetales bacterium]